MNIMFDLDSTLVLNTVVIDTLYEYLSFEDAYAVIHNLCFDYTSHEGIPDHVKAMIDSRFADGLIMTSLKPNLHAQAVVKDLTNQGHSIYVITARGATDGEVKDVTPAFVKDLFPSIKGIALTGHNKNRAIKELNIDLVVEDSTRVIDNILDSTEINPNIILLSNENTPWNWNYKRANEIIVLDSLLEIPFIVDEIGETNLI